jgi:hypothetical protein
LQASAIWDAGALATDSVKWKGEAWSGPR